MRLLTAILACGHLKAAHWHERRAGVMLDRIRERRRGSAPATIAAAERMLLASIVGLGITSVWFWMAWRAAL